MKKNWVKSYKNNQNTLIRLWDQAAVDDITVFDYDSATQQWYKNIFYHVMIQNTYDIFGSIAEPGFFGWSRNFDFTALMSYTLLVTAGGISNPWRRTGSLQK